MISRLVYSLTILWLLSATSVQGQKQRTASELITDVYHGCGFDKYCLKICHELQPSCSKCISEYNCPAMVSVELRDDKYYSQMLVQRLGASHTYISIGLSRDTKMGEDIVVVCLVSGPEDSPHHHHGNATRVTNMFGAWTTGLKTMDYDITYESHPYYDLRHEMLDGIYVCTFEWKRTFTVQTKTRNISYNLETEQFYLMGARGEAASNWRILGHQKSEVARVIGTSKATLSGVPELDDYDERFEERGASLTVSNILLVTCFILATISFRPCQICG